MTSLDKYQFVNILYLVLCCVSHSTMASVKLDTAQRVFADKVVLAIFVFLFVLIQVIFGISLFVAYQKIRALKKRETQYMELTKDTNFHLENDDE